MNNDLLLALIGVSIPALGAFAVAVRYSRTTDRTSARSASADEVEKLGDRLDKQSERMDKQDTKIEKQQRTIRALYAYIALDHAQHHTNGWPINPMPEDLA